jgi:CubicO group peptidase (beta-lactamase class C family)
MRPPDRKSFVVVATRPVRALAAVALLVSASCDGTDSPTGNAESIETVRSAVTSGLAKINLGVTSTSLSGWVADQDCDNGALASTSGGITISPQVVNPAPQAVYQSAHVTTSTGAGTFTCTLPGFTQGKSYLVRLHFADWQASMKDLRRFNVTINGLAALTNFDVFVAAAGQSRAVIKEFTVSADSAGKIAVGFTRVTGQAMVNGIEVVNSTLAPPTRINAAGAAFGGFAADVGFSGGATFTSTHTIATAGVTHAAVMALYQTGRTTASTGTNTTSFTYTVPGFGASTTNTVRLHFAETVKTAAGQRLFHVSVNGTRVLDSFDIFAAAGGADRAIVREFRAQADGAGNYAIKFEKLASPVGAPLVSGIEVVRSVPWFMRSNMTSAQYQAEYTARAAAGYRLTYVNGYAGSGGTRFVAVWDLTPGSAFTAGHDIPRTGFDGENAAKAAAGWSLALVNCYSSGTSDFCAAIWTVRSSPPPMITKVGMDDATYLAEFNAQAGAGYRQVHISGYTVNGQARFASTWELRTSPAWYSLHFLNATDMAAQVASFKGRGYRVVDLTGFNVGGTDYYDALFEVSPGGPTVENYDVGAGLHALRADDLHRQGYAPVVVTAFPTSGGEHFASLWQNTVYSAADLTTIDNLALTAIFGGGFNSLSLAVIKDGRLVFGKPYGFASGTTEEAHVSSLYRVASISKTVTSAAINRLIDQGKVNLDSKVFGPEVLDHVYGNPASYTAGMENITIRQLLSHTSGLADNQQMWDPANSTATVMAAVVNGPLGAQSYNYQNMNFYVLGRVIDKLTGGASWTITSPRTYESWVTQNVLAPSGIQAMSLGANTLAGRKANEVTYTPAATAYVNNNLPNLDASGGWIASPIDLLRLVTHIDGTSTVPDILAPATMTRMYAEQTSGANYGLGWHLEFNGNGTPFNVWHDGAFHGALGVVKRFAAGLGMAASTNCNPCSGPETNALGILSRDLGTATVTWPQVDLFDSPN